MRGHRCYRLRDEPFSLAELVARIRARVDTSAGTGGRFPPVAPIRLGLVRSVVDTGGGAVSLSGREFALLERLVARPGGVCSRRGLLETVWGSSVDVRSNLVDVYVRRLRSRIWNELIETVRSTGYRIDVPTMDDGPWS